MLDIKQVAEKETEIEAGLREFFDKLNKESESPLCGYLSPSESKRGMISRVTFNRSLKPILENNLMNKLPREKQYELIKNFLKAIEHAIEETSLIYKSAYFEAFCGLFDDVMRLSYTKHKKYKLDSLIDVLSPLKNIDISGILTAGKTKITKSTILPHLKEAISGQIVVYEDMI